MNGRTIIPILGTTVHQEALTVFRRSGQSREQFNKRMMSYCDGAKPGTIRAMINDYVDGMSLSTYQRFRRECCR